ncbi:hypothetical protein J6590_053647 [Homalodisca vitripennis]|nr:hypothetical protein J6590_053647 [Homalodisca vitripennis]
MTSCGNCPVSLRHGSRLSLLPITFPPSQSVCPSSRSFYHLKDILLRPSSCPSSWVIGRCKELIKQKKVHSTRSVLIKTATVTDRILLSLVVAAVSAQYHGAAPSYQGAAPSYQGAAPSYQGAAPAPSHGQGGYGKDQGGATSFQSFRLEVGQQDYKNPTHGGQPSYSKPSYSAEPSYNKPSYQAAPAYKPSYSSSPAYSSEPSYSSGPSYKPSY